MQGDRVSLTKFRRYASTAAKLWHTSSHIKLHSHLSHSIGPDCGSLTEFRRYASTAAKVWHISCHDKLNILSVHSIGPDQTMNLQSTSHRL